jgi:ZIP family zinc transporter
MEGIYLILIISIIGPVLGSAIGVLKKPSHTFMYNMLAFAAGVMLSISFLELIPESLKIISVPLSILGILLGAVVMYIFDKLIPHIHPELCENEQGTRIKKTSIYLILGIALHNFPEGMAIAIGEITNFKATFAMALAIAIHNIPEGICTSAPYYYICRKKLKAFLISSATAIPIILGFFFAKFLFNIISPLFSGIILAATAGIMIYISADELIPSSCNKTNKAWNHGAIFSLILGIVFVMILNAL